MRSIVLNEESQLLILTEVRKHNRKIEHLNTLNKNLVYWDTLNNMPFESIQSRLELVSYIYDELINKYKNNDYIKLIKILKNLEITNENQKIYSMVRKVEGKYRSLKLIPKNEYLSYKKTLTEVEKKWILARKKESFEIITPDLIKVIDYHKKLAEYYGYNSEPYEAFISYNYPDYSFEYIMGIFEKIKSFSLSKLNEIKNKDSYKKSLNFNIDNFYFNKSSQKKMTIDILNRIGFNFKYGRLDEGKYPTVLAVNNKDVRIITNYNTNDFVPSFTTALHTGSQAIYEQSISSDLYSYLLAKPCSMIFLEAVANFYENILGKSKEFWEFYLERFKSLYTGFENLNIEQIYMYLNRVKPQLIRMDSDELTYLIHIIIRVEIERDLINGKICVKELPEVWDCKYESYLGIKPTKPSLGILQDVHWVSGYFGYFPNYILGKILSYQIYNQILKDIPDYYEIVAKGNWLVIKEWFDQNIFASGSLYNTEELINIVTDESLNVDYFIKYLDDKYNKLYT